MWIKFKKWKNVSIQINLRAGFSGFPIVSGMNLVISRPDFPMLNIGGFRTNNVKGKCKGKGEAGKHYEIENYGI